MKKVMVKIHSFTHAFEMCTVFLGAIVAGFAAYSAKMKEWHDKQGGAAEERDSE